MVMPIRLERFCHNTAMFIPTVTYDTVTSFLLGFNWAHEGCLLRGFNEWLVLRVGTGTNLVWSELPLYLAFPSVLNPRQELTSEANNQKAIQVLFECLESFFKETSDSLELRKLFVRYHRWIEKQPWYSEGSPDFVA